MIYMYKIGIMGDKDTIMVFKTLGVDTFPVEDEKESRSLLRRLARDNYGIIYITEPLAEKIMDLISEYEDSMTPAIILIPTNQGSLGIGIKHINDSVEKAIGVNILLGEEADKN